MAANGPPDKKAKGRYDIMKLEGLATVPTRPDRGDSVLIFILCAALSPCR